MISIRSIFLCLMLILSVTVQGKALVSIALMPSSQQQKEVLVKALSSFEKSQSEIAVKTRFYEPEEFKGNIQTLLTSPKEKIDVFIWFAGQRLSELLAADLVEPIDNLWSPEEWKSVFSAASLSAVKRNEHIYALPLYYYQWGFYYRKSLLRSLSLTAPKTWSDLVTSCKVLGKANLTPIALGTQAEWPALAWFDYVNLRTNGLAFHHTLLSGKESFADPRVEAVFSQLEELVKLNCFNTNAPQLSWKEAASLMTAKQAGFFLMGNFFTPNIPEEVRSDIGFFRFPEITPNIPHFEDAPLDILVVNKQSTASKEAIYKLLTHFSDASIQGALAAGTGKIPPNKHAFVSHDRLIVDGIELLNQAEGSAQFFDRDAPSALSASAKQVLSKFLAGQISKEEAINTLKNTPNVP